MPSNDWLDYLRHDYETMQVMIFGDSPSFDEILDGLQALAVARFENLVEELHRR